MTVEKIEKQIIKIRNDEYKVVDDMDYSQGLDIIEFRDKNNNISRPEFLAGILPLLIKILIPEAVQYFYFNYEEKKYLYKDQGLGYCEIELLIKDLYEKEAQIIRDRLPYLFKENLENSNEAQAEKNEVSALKDIAMSN